MEILTKTKSSLWMLIGLSIWLITFRTTHIDKKEISWDVFGYYLPLQATFIEDDMWLNDRSWVEELNEKHQVSGTLYQISTTPDNEPMYFFFFGMSIMYSVFFFAGHFFAGMFGYPQDGLSDPYSFALVLGCVFYTLVGLYYLRKILLQFFSDNLVAILLFICVLGTNFSHHMTIKNLETVNILFMFATIVIWNTIRWHENHKLKNILAIGVSVVLMALIKPSEVLIIFLPVLWGVWSKDDLKERFSVLWRYKNQILITIAVGLLIATPQIIYWYVKTGMFFYDSYKNPGVGLDLTNPHLYESLFGYRKGWLIYTPVMIFALLGFIIIFKQQKKLFFGLFIPFIVAFYIIASWTEYWYGASFSNRPIIAQYPILLIAMGFLFNWIAKQQQVVKVVTALIIVFLVFLNQFQWWQLRNYILDGTRMTKAYYWATFLKKSATDKKLLLLSRSYNGYDAHFLNNPEDYKSKFLLTQKEIETEGSPEFMNTVHIPYKQLTKKDHCYVRFRMDYRIVGDKDTYWATMMNRENGEYGYFYYQLNKQSDEWQKFDTLYLTPEIRSVEDYLKFFIWNPNLQSFEAKNLRIDILERN
jgi:hypothetical protein